MHVKVSSAKWRPLFFTRSHCVKDRAPAYSNAGNGHQRDTPYCYKSLQNNSTMPVDNHRCD